MAVPVLVNSDTVESNLTSNEETFDVTPATNIADNDIILIIGALDGIPTGFASSGFTKAFEQVEITDELVTLVVLWKRALSESGDYTVTWTDGEKGRFMCCRVTGCIANGDPTDVLSGQTSSPGSTTRLISVLTSTVVDTLAIYGLACDRDRIDSGDTMTGTGWSVVGVSGSEGSSGGAGLIVVENDMPTIATVETGTFGTWASDENVSKGFNLKSVNPPIVERIYESIVNQSVII